MASWLSAPSVESWWWWPGSAERTAKAHFCSAQFPALWEPWVQQVCDFGFAGFSTAASPSISSSAASTSALAPDPEVPSVLPAAERLVAIGDLHGDLRKALRAFRLAGLIDERGRWSGGSTVCVQVSGRMHAWECMAVHAAVGSRLLSGA